MAYYSQRRSQGECSRPWAQDHSLRGYSFTRSWIKIMLYTPHTCTCSICLVKNCGQEQCEKCKIKTTISWMKHGVYRIGDFYEHVFSAYWMCISAMLHPRLNHRVLVHFKKVLTLGKLFSGNNWNDTYHVTSGSF